MTDNGRTTTQFRHGKAEKERWKEAAEDHNGGNLSEYIRDMVTAGQKKFSSERGDAERVRELRRQLREKDEELHRRDDRIRRLEKRASGGEKAVIRETIEAAGSEEWIYLLDTVKETAPERARRYLEELSADGEIAAWKVEADDDLADVPPPVREGPYEVGTVVFYDTEADGYNPPPKREADTDHEAEYSIEDFRAAKGDRR